MEQLVVDWLLEELPILKTQIPLSILNEAKQKEKDKMIRWGIYFRDVKVTKRKEVESLINETYKFKEND